MKCRFKTEKELIEEFGKNWKCSCHMNDNNAMDYLLGTPLTEQLIINHYIPNDTFENYMNTNKTKFIKTIYIKNINNDSFNYKWAISPKLIIIINSPQYKSLKLDYAL